LPPEPTPPSPPGPPVPVVHTLDITVPPSSFVDDSRSAYDGAIGGTLASGFVAIPGLAATPNRVFWWSQSDGSAQRGQNPANWFPELAGYADIEVPLPAGLVSAQDVALALEAEMSAFSEYTIAQVGVVPTASWSMRVTGTAIDADNAFTGGDFSSRGQAGIWGIHVDTILGTGSDGEGPVGNCNSQYAQAPLLGSTRVLAMDVYIGTAHAAGSQFRLALFEGGDTLSPVGSTLLYDFGQISGTVTNGWVRVWVDLEDMVMPGNGSNLWLTVKNNAGGTNIAGFFTGSPWNGDFLDQDFWQSSSMSADPAVAFEGVYTAGGAHGSTFILGLRLVYDSAPYTADGSLRRRYGTHEPVSAATNSASIDSQLIMSGTPPQILGLELDQIWMPYGTVHTDAGGQFRLGAAQGGAAIDDPTGAVRIADVGQTSGIEVNDFVEISAPGPGASAVAIDIADLFSWWVKNNDATITGSQIAFANSGGGGLTAINPPDNPMDWTVNGVGTNPEYEMFPPQIVSDPALAFEANVVTSGVPPDQRPGNYPWAAVIFRVNGIDLAAS
jgi:hypothetical protein